MGLALTPRRGRGEHELTGRATVGGDFRDIRFDFADEVLVQLLGEDGDLHALVEGLQEGVVAMWRFAQASFKRYLDEIPQGVIRPVGAAG